MVRVWLLSEIGTSWLLLVRNMTHDDTFIKLFSSNYNIGAETGLYMILHYTQLYRM